MLKKERLRDYLAYKVVSLFQTTFKARLMDKLPVYKEAAFCNGVRCYISSSKELKRSQQEFDPQVLKWLQSFEPGDVFYDIGANIGMFSLTAAQFYKKQVRVYAFEPSFSTFSSLVHNVIANQFGDVIYPFSFALGNFQGIRSFNYKNLIPGESVHTLDKQINQMGTKFEPVFSQQVISYSLDGIVESFKLDLPTHIKIDVDGGEAEIVQGMKHLLAGTAIKSVMVEITKTEDDDASSMEINKVFESSGFKRSLEIVHRSNKKLPIISDVLFTKNWNVFS